MFGGVGTILLVGVMRVLVGRAWRDGIGLSLARRLAAPGVTLVLALVSLRHGGQQLLGSPLALVVALSLVVTATGGVVRARSVDYSSVPDTPVYPGGVCIRARNLTSVVDVAAVVCSAAVIFPSVAPVDGLPTAAGAWTLTVVLGDLVASVLLVLRGRPAVRVR